MDIFGGRDYGVIVEDGMGYCGGDGTTGGVGLSVEEIEIVGQCEDREEIRVGGYRSKKEREKVVLC